VKALSVQQPWAWLIVNGWKNVENRTWKTNVRGEIAIHAGKTFDHAGYEWVEEAFPEIWMPSPEEFEKGGIVGTVKIHDCVEEMTSPWFFGPYGFVLVGGLHKDFKPCRGQLGFFNVDY